jgi:hypothetical protein
MLQRMAMDKETLAYLRTAGLVLTLAQRPHLKTFVDSRLEPLDASICERLFDLGLVRRSGDALIATDAERPNQSILMASRYFRSH